MVSSWFDNLVQMKDAAYLRQFVARARMSEHNEVWPEYLSERSHTNAVHGFQVEVHENRVGTKRSLVASL